MLERRRGGSCRIRLAAPRVERATTLAGVHAVLPPHRYMQAELTSAFTEVCLGPDGNQALLGRLQANAKVRSRHLVLPLEHYAALPGLRESSDPFIAGVGMVPAGACAAQPCRQRCWTPPGSPG
jgi:predicted naringenin-chalcone synthase